MTLIGDAPSETSYRGKLRLLGTVSVNGIEIELKYLLWVYYIMDRSFSVLEVVSLDFWEAG